MTKTTAKTTATNPSIWVIGTLMLFLGAIVATAANASDDEDCPESKTIDEQIELAGVSEIAIEAGAGFLTVAGESGSAAIQLLGTACAGRARDLEKITIESEVKGNTLVLRTVIPDGKSWIGNDYTKLNLEIQIPTELSVRIIDTSGSLTVRNVAAVEIEDKSGSILVQDVAGMVNIVDDGSGSITVQRAGSLKIGRDGSGSITASEITENVYVGRDGSGSIFANDVGGSFTVVSDSSGSVRHNNVAGDVQIGD